MYIHNKLLFNQYNKNVKKKLNLKPYAQQQF